MKKFTILTFMLLFSVFWLKAQTPLNTAVNFTANDAGGNSHTLFDYLDNNKYVVIMFTMPG